MDPFLIVKKSIVDSTIVIVTEEHLRYSSHSILSFTCDVQVMRVLYEQCTSEP